MEIEIEIPKEYEKIGKKLKEWMTKFENGPNY